ncbi:DUF3883 domain-containing protein [Cellulomonas humilata]|uniref:DUF3883 domain-containing protein n=1 Tax=Cellulomonas humilata TaxID=144055 RepID=A0A7Y6A3F5_9CELL|nr:DUF3883 domain-containing protein [Cellulomonas humilata]NUU19049.1 DUF3883 domain-containing protein [Cellulomonas humilata]
MAVNLHLTDWHDAAADDAWGRSSVGWRDDLSDAELWELNRGTWLIGDAAEAERYATMSHNGAVRVVAELTGAREPVVEGSRVLHALVGHVLAPGHRAYDALIGRPVRGRHVSYLDTTGLDSRAPWHAANGFMLTHNPDMWHWDEQEFATAVAATRAGSLYRDSWSMGAREGGVDAGDRAFLVRLGDHGRGIIASGRITGPIYSDEHFDGSGRQSNFVLVDWDTILEPDDRLELTHVEASLPGQHWHPQGSGIRIRDEVLPQLEGLWASHLRGLGRAGPAPSGEMTGSTAPVSRGAQGWQDDPAVRKAVENLAQSRLEAHFRSSGWVVSDVRHSKFGYDALAVKGSDERYLEAKGTVTTGVSVIVSPAEVAFARRNLGKCVMGILSNVSVSADGQVDASSGTFQVIDWNPDAGTLRPRGYDWTPAQPRS